MSEKLKIVYRPLQELSPYAHNARTHSTEQVAQLVESITAIPAGMKIQCVTAGSA
ncbi:hypothetical protein KZB05_01720 [Escherichia coli]|nr:hypothetical protein [Escherichia coli]EKJ6210020.1 hypothetical protein [Escherichia coli]EKJ6295040.1 hypothetical protein [Escherichia coli]MBW9000503.1 hypothetical protein [Escherichia coli]HEB5783877.1 hypothetical protein [Escherichia coli]